jgi:hypothetical protein
MSDGIAFLQGCLDIMRNGRIGGPGLCSSVVHAHSAPNAIFDFSTTANVDPRETSGIFMLKHQEVDGLELLKA